MGQGLGWGGGMSQDCLSPETPVFLPAFVHDSALTAVALQAGEALEDIGWETPGKPLLLCGPGEATIRYWVWIF